MVIVSEQTLLTLYILHFTTVPDKSRQPGFIYQQAIGALNNPDSSYLVKTTDCALPEAQMHGVALAGFECGNTGLPKFMA